MEPWGGSELDELVWTGIWDIDGIVAIKVVGEKNSLRSQFVTLNIFRCGHKLRPGMDQHRIRKEFVTALQQSHRWETVQMHLIKQFELIT